MSALKSGCRVFPFVSREVCAKDFLKTNFPSVIIRSLAVITYNSLGGINQNSMNHGIKVNLKFSISDDIYLKR